MAEEAEARLARHRLVLLEVQAVALLGAVVLVLAGVPEHLVKDIVAALLLQVESAAATPAEQAVVELVDQLQTEKMQVTQ
jgi:hypothetical protein